MGKTSLRDWVEEIPWMQQGVLFSAIRSADGIPHEDNSKIIVRGYRNVVLKPAHNIGSFLGKIPTQEKLQEAMENFVHGFGQYNTHFVLHLVHGAEIIGYQHPDDKISETWGDFYSEMCRAMHVNPETKEQMNKRLKDNPEVTGRYE
jgi:hypothetical protein